MDTTETRYPVLAQSRLSPILSDEQKNLLKKARVLIVEKELVECHQAIGREVPVSLVAMSQAYAAVLEDVPDAHLRECFKRARKANRTAFLPTSGAVLTEWDILLGELRDEAAAVAERESARLRAGHGSLSHIGPVEFKRRHNLPDDWKPGDPYPPQSDLYNAPVPSVEQRKNVRPPGKPPTSLFWHERQKAPWELYPPQENPAVNRIKVRGMDGKTRMTTFVWWVQRCPGHSCRGWVEEHTGPEGRWVRWRSCPNHYTGQPEPAFYTIAAPQPEPSDRQEWDVEQEEEQGRAMWQNYTRTEAPTATITEEDDDEDFPF